MGRNPCSSKEELNRGAWTADEDRVLRAFVETHGEGRWRRLPKKAGLKRCGKSCRLRWLNYLRPDIKRGNITREEEDLIIRLHKLLGNRWSLIAGRLPGRTDNEIKNYWNTHLRKKVQDQQQLKVEVAMQMNVAVSGEQIVENTKQNAIVEQVVGGDPATEKAAESKSDDDSCFAPHEDKWWDCLMGLDGSNTCPSKSLGFNLIHDIGVEDWMSEYRVFDTDLELKSWASYPSYQEEWHGFRMRTKD